MLLQILNGQVHFADILLVVPDAYYKNNKCNRHRQFTLGLNY